jgi:hypothetical protein
MLSVGELRTVQARPMGMLTAVGPGARPTVRSRQPSREGLAMLGLESTERKRERTRERFSLRPQPSLSLQRPAKLSRIFPRWWVSHLHHQAEETGVSFSQPATPAFQFGSPATYFVAHIMACVKLLLFVRRHNLAWSGPDPPGLPGLSTP